MKKLELKGSVREMLSKNQMKLITGGASCTAQCVSGKTITCTGNTCFAEDYNANFDGWCIARDSNNEVIEDGIVCE